MAHIFEIAKPDTVLRFEGKDYKLRDPGFSEKVLLQEKMEKLDEKIQKELREEGASFEVMKRRREVNAELVKKFLPDMDEKVLLELPQSDFEALQQAVLQAIAMKFGAQVKVHEGDAAKK